MHWEFLYAPVSLQLARLKEVRKKVLLDLTAVRVSLCQQLALSEELVPLHCLTVFLVRHERHAQLALRYPDTAVVKDAMSWGMVDVYRKTFRGQLLNDTAYKSMREAWHGSYGRAVKLATDDNCVVFPNASVDACFVGDGILYRMD